MHIIARGHDVVTGSLDVPDSTRTITIHLPIPPEPKTLTTLDVALNTIAEELRMANTHEERALILSRMMTAVTEGMLS